jgi:hypothetical protein
VRFECETPRAENHNSYARFVRIGLAQQTFKRILSVCVGLRREPTPIRLFCFETDYTPPEFSLINLSDIVSLEKHLEQFVSESKELIRLLRLDLAQVLTYSSGSARYKQVLNAYEYLTYARQQILGVNHTKWERTLVKGKNGDFLIACLHDIKGYLESIGEGETESYFETQAG